MMNTRVRAVTALLAVMALGACRDPLSYTTLTQPDVDRIFAQPASIEQAIASGYQVCRNSSLSSSVYQQIATMSGESYSNLNNFNMGPRGAIPRTPIQNNKSAQQAENGRFSALSRNARTAANAVRALDRLVTNGGTLGSPGQNARARAFGFMVIACNMGYASMVWDSVGMVDHLMTSDSVPPLSSGEDAALAVIALLDSAIAVASSPAATTSGGFPTPVAWLSGDALTAAEFIQWANSWKARVRTGVTRTKAARDALPWSTILTWAEAGLQRDIMVETGGTTGWDIGFQGSQMHVDAAWHQIGPMYYGFADVSGNFQTWINLPVSARAASLIVSPDLRWPQGATRAAQQANSQEPSGYLDMPYIKNRTAADTPADPWGESFYEQHRYKYIRNNSLTGPQPIFLKAEVDMLVAEAAIRLTQFSKAAGRIDIWRGRAGLPLLTGVVNNGTTPVPGGQNCVPKVPSTSSSTLTCGTMMEAMKYEKRMEVSFHRLGAWFFDSRGWEDLFTDTPLEYPVPVDEIDARYPLTLPYYNLGGGGPSSAVKGTYGYP